MVEVRYKNHFELADLDGRGVAETRELYKSRFGIPDGAQARLNGKGIRRKQEAKATLSANDKLSFEAKRRTGLVFVGAALLVLFITGGLFFARAATTATITLSLTQKQDFASVTAAPSLPTWNVWGSYKGAVSPGDLAIITPEASFTGDMVAMFTLANAEDLVEAYRVLVLELEIYDSSGTPQQVGTTEYLTLAKGDVTIEINQAGLTAPYTVQITGGSYMTNRGGWAGGQEDPLILVDVIQKGAM